MQCSRIRKNPKESSSLSDKLQITMKVDYLDDMKGTRGEYKLRFAKFVKYLHIIVKLLE